MKKKNLAGKSFKLKKTGHLVILLRKGTPTG
jgi:hypothetical protein